MNVKTKKPDLVFFDVDETILKGQSQKHFIDYLFEKKMISLSSYLKIIFWFLLYKLKLTDNPKKILEYALKKTIENKNNDYVKKITKDFFNKKLKPLFFQEALLLIKKHQKNKREIVLISNSLEIILNEISNFLKTKYFLGTSLETKKNIYTGKIIGKINYGKNKSNNIKKFIKENNFSLINSWGYGDHFSDHFMLNLVKHPFVVNGDKKLKKMAKEKKWKSINFNK